MYLKYQGIIVLIEVLTDRAAYCLYEWGSESLEYEHALFDLGAALARMYRIHLEIQSKRLQWQYKKLSSLRKAG